MNSRNGLVFLVILAAVSPVTGVCGDTEATNLVRNGGFEAKASDGKKPAVWHATEVRLTRGFVTFAWDGEIAHSGRRSVSIAIDEAHPDQTIHYNWNQHVSGFKPGESYQVTAWVKTDNMTAPPFIVVQCWNWEMTEIVGSASSQNLADVDGTSDWVQVKIPLTVPDKTQRMVILAGVAAPLNRGGRAWFDDIHIVATGSD